MLPERYELGASEYLGKSYGDTDGVRAALASYRRTQPPPPPSDAVVASLAILERLSSRRSPTSRLPSQRRRRTPAVPEFEIGDKGPRGVESEPQSASVHPSSVRGRLNGSHWPSPYCCFHEKVRTTKVYVQDATPTPPLAPFLLTGNNLEGETTLVLDGWLKCVVEGGSVVRDFRDVVSRKVSDLLSGKDLGNDGTALLSGLEALSALEASALPEKASASRRLPRRSRSEERQQQVAHEAAPGAAAVAYVAVVALRALVEAVRAARRGRVLRRRHRAQCAAPRWLIHRALRGGTRTAGGAAAPARARAVDDPSLLKSVRRRILRAHVLPSGAHGRRATCLVGGGSTQSGVLGSLCRTRAAARQSSSFAWWRKTMGDPAGDGIATDVATTRPMRSTRASVPETASGDAAA